MADKEGFETDDRMVQILVFVFVGVHIQQFMLSLQHLDERPSALLDVMFDNELNSVHRAQMGLSGIVLGGCEFRAPLHYLYDFINSCAAAGSAISVQEFHGRCSDVALDMSAQLWWRFRFLQEYPHRWALLHHPRVGHDQRLDCAVKFFKLKKCSCCRTNEFCEKVWKTFWDGAQF